MPRPVKQPAPPIQVLVVALVAGGVIAACASAPPRATAEGCARARLARDFKDASPEPFVGCFVDERDPAGGVIELTAAEEPADYADEPRRFALVMRGSGLAGERRGHWELLAKDVVRLRILTRAGVLLSAAVGEACVERAGDELVGVTYAVLDHAPYVGESAPLRLRRVGCAP